MKAAEILREACNTLWSDTYGEIEHICKTIGETEFELDTIHASIIIDDFDGDTIDVVNITRISENGILYAEIDDEEVDLPYTMMGVEGLIDLLSSLEDYYNGTD